MDGQAAGAPVGPLEDGDGPAPAGADRLDPIPHAHLRPRGQAQAMGLRLAHVQAQQPGPAALLRRVDEGRAAHPAVAEQRDPATRWQGGDDRIEQRGQQLGQRLRPGPLLRHLLPRPPRQQPRQPRLDEGVNRGPSESSWLYEAWLHILETQTPYPVRAVCESTVANSARLIRKPGWSTFLPITITTRATARPAVCLNSGRAGPRSRLPCGQLRRERRP
jgi:hypothetical protein